MFSTPAPPCLLQREQRSVPLPHLACYTENSVQYPCAVPSCLLYKEQCSVPLCCPILLVTQRTVFSTSVAVPSCLLHREQCSVPLCCPILPVTQRTMLNCSVPLWLSHLAFYTEHCSAPSPLPCLLQRYTFPVTQRRVCRTLPCYTPRNDTQNMKAKNTRTKTDSEAGRQADKQCNPLTKDSQAGR